MKRALFVAGLCLVTVTAHAQPPAGGGQRPQLTPEQRAALEAKREAEMKAPRPIEALDSVWMEELTWMEVRDAIAGDKTTALILAGKHNFILKVMGEAIARKLGNALVAPIVTLEPGRPDGERVAPGSVFLSQATYRGVLTDMAESLRGMGFKNVILMGDSGGNQKPMQEVVNTLNAKYTSVQKLVQDNGIAEQIKPGASSGSDGIHDEYGIDALMALYDPDSIRIEQRKKANRTTINGVSLLPIEKTLGMGKKIVELRTKLTVDAIQKALAAAR
jgi:creatinine amidohydrolase